MDILIEETKEGLLSISSPYNPFFVRKIKALGAKWQPGSKRWIFRAELLGSVRSLCQQIYGRDDRQVETVDVEIDIYEELYARCKPFTLFGRNVASAFGRDSGAKIGEGVAFLRGAPTSGGSVKNWYTVIPKNSTIRLFGVPKSAVENRFDFLDESDYTLRILTGEDNPVNVL